jgi:hypothetical protein
MVSKMAKGVASFRLDSEALDVLKRLSDSWGVSQAQVIELLIKEAVRENRQLRPVATREET